LFVVFQLYGYFAFITKGPKQNIDDVCVTEDGDDVIIQPTANPQLIWESLPIEGCGTQKAEKQQTKIRK
jgi:virulence-associated protein VagC